jgi:cytoskeletal protein CcmA (bactofilin family)
MSTPPRRRIVDAISPSPTFIGAGTTLVGDLRCEGDLAVAGDVTGDAQLQGSFTLSQGAQWLGNVAARNAVLAGDVQGSVDCVDKLEIRQSARVHGAVRARSIAIAEGAVIDGEMSVTSSAPIVRYQEKRHD